MTEYTALGIFGALVMLDGAVAFVYLLGRQLGAWPTGNDLYVAFFFVFVLVFRAFYRWSLGIGGSTT